MSAPLADRTVLVTGGSRGIGRAVVEAVHRDGAHVIVHSSRVETGRAVREALGGERVHALAGDLTEAGAAAQVWAEALAWRRRIDVLVNNAGAWLASPLDDEASWDDGWALNLALNLLAPATLCRLAIGHFRSHGGGVIVNVASRSAHRGDDADHLSYGAAKGGLLALTKGIARGFAHERILAYAVAPGWRRRSPKRPTSQDSPPPCRCARSPQRSTSPRWWLSSPPAARRTPRAPPSTSPAPTTCAEEITTVTA